MGHRHFDVVGVVQHCSVCVGGDDAAHAGRLGRVSEVGGYETAQRARFVGDLVDLVDDGVEAADGGVADFRRQDPDEVKWFEVDAVG